MLGSILKQKQCDKSPFRKFAAILKETTPAPTGNKITSSGGGKHELAALFVDWSQQLRYRSLRLRTTEPLPAF
jgi:hypothetical protein